MINIRPAPATPMNPARHPQMSITWPSTAAPAATPAARPVEVQASASVSRLGGTEAWVTATDAINVGAIAIPLSIRSRATTTGLLTKISGSNERARLTAPTRNRLAGEAFQAMVPVTAPDSSEPEGPGHQDHPGVLQDAGGLGERDDDDLHAAEHHAQCAAGDGDGKQDAHRKGVRSAAFSAAGVDRRLRAPLRGQGHGAHQSEGAAGRDAERGMQRGGQEGDEHGTDDEHHLVEHRFEGECRVQQR